MTEKAAGKKGSIRPSWIPALKQYETPSTRTVVLQLMNTLLPYFALLVVMYLTIRWDFSYLLTLLLAVPAGAFLVRLFIFFHDCCHGSYLASKRGMHALGTFLGILTFTAFGDWRHSHGIHHSTAGNLDRRGIGDVWTMTRDEYLAAPRWKRFAYRSFRHPLVMFGIGPLYTFLITNRFSGSYSTKEDKRSILFTNLALLSVVIAAAFTIGLRTYLLIQLPVIYFAGLAGVWLFYVQHQFDPSYWARTEDWGSMEAALEGSSYYRLPGVLRWFSANIGLHHIHHLRPRIANYNLQRCLLQTPELQLKDHLTILRSIRSVHLNLWDEANGKLISFRDLRRERKRQRREPG